MRVATFVISCAAFALSLFTYVQEEKMFGPVTALCVHHQEPETGPCDKFLFGK
jgi:hypothetical protein